MKVIFVVLSLFVAFQVNSQNYIRTIDSLDPWAGQLKYDYELVSRFDKYCRANNLMTYSLEMLDARNENLWNFAKSVDINNDGLKDVVYSGPSGGEPNVVYFFIQTSSGFDQVFEVMQGIVKVTWEGELLNQVFVSDWGCCAAIHLVNSVYDVEYDGRYKRPIFRKVFQSIEVGGQLVKPKNYFSDPIEFVVENDGYKLRIAPMIDDSTTFHSIEITGNTFATLRQGTTGTALASQTDDTGRIWWYVAIDFDKNVQNCIMRTPDEFPTKVIGWLSSRYVTNIEN